MNRVTLIIVVCGCISCALFSLPVFTRIDSHLVIKITDFGLSEDVFVRNYFRQGTSEEIVKLPVKWMAPESLSDGHFSEKSDVVSYQTSLIENTSEQSVSKSTLNYLYRFPTWFRWYFPNWNYNIFYAMCALLL